MAVFVLDRKQNPLMPCSEKRARKLLIAGRARVHRLCPFAIRLVDRTADNCDFQRVTIKLDPGSKTTGIAIVRESEALDVGTGEVTVTAHVLNLIDLVHRGRQISYALTARSQMRRRRRGNLRYRQPRFLNRGNKKQGWLAPSLQHRIDTSIAWVRKFRGLAPVMAIAQELVRFDLQKMDNADISGVEYQQGTLSGYEIREYVLEKWGRKCAYCDAKDVPLNLDHVHAKSLGGSNRVSNLVLACVPCNSKKSARNVREFLFRDAARLERILKQLQQPLHDAAAVNTTRWALWQALKTTGLTVTTGSGGLTKFNRHKLGIPKTHALDAACVGRVDAIENWCKPVLTIKCTGRGSYQRTRMDAFGFARGYLTRSKRIHGFQTGDMVSADVVKGKKIGTYRGRVAVRASGSFNIQTFEGVVQGISHRHCKVIQRADGYGYSQVSTMDATGTPPKQGTLRVPRSASPA